MVRGLLDANSEQTAIDIKEDNVIKGAGGAAKGSLEEFYYIVDIIKKNVNRIHETTQSLKEINQNLILATEENATESQNIDQLILSGNKIAKIAQNLLKDLNRECKLLESVKNETDLRIRKNLVQTLTKKYIDELKDYQNTQNEMKEIRTKKATKQVKQVKPDATPEEIDAIIHSGKAGNLMKEEILMVSIIIFCMRSL
jgi:t-SNARE complex subunit (syntaxin)